MRLGQQGMRSALVQACAILSGVGLRVAAAAAEQTTTVLKVPVSPADCGHGDCSAALQAAVLRCRAAQPPCAVQLAPGEYRVRCRAAARPSASQREGAAISLDGTRLLTFGGGSANSRATILVDYHNGGCAAIGATNASDVMVQHVVVDAYRLPFTVGAVVSATAREVRFLPEADAADRPGVYAWDTSAYQWLDKTFASQVVPVGSRATRQLPEIGLSCSRSSAVASADALSSCYASSVEESTGIVTLRFDDALSLRAELKPKTRVFLKHFGNMQAWGIVAFNSSNVSVIGSTLWSISGMGYRADFCTQRYLLKDSHVELKPGTVRPMSITADATHWMHHSGEILMDSCSFQGQGDDGCNPHGNFIVIVRATDRNTVEYISERGPGWVGDAPTHMIGDEVQFFSRGTLQRIDDASSEGSVIVAATESSVTFSRPLPAKAKPFDMFLSLKRVASLKMRRCFFGNSNARGIVLSAVNATIEDCRFANLSSPAIDIMEGGCGCTAGDYTEGPFAENVMIHKNLFENTAAVSRRQGAGGLNINNLATVQIGSCVPIGRCGVSGGNDLGPTADGEEARNLDLAGDTLRIIRFSVPRPAKLHALKFYVSGRQPPPLGSKMALYSSTYHKGSQILPTNHPTERLVLTGNHTDSFVQREDGWWAAQVTNATLNGSYYIAHYFPSGGSRWSTRRSSGVSEESAAGALGLPANLVRNWSIWQSAGGIPIAAEWTPHGDWCKIGGTLPPPVTINNGGEPLSEGGLRGGHLQEPGSLLQGGLHATRNISIIDNVFVAPRQETAKGPRPPSAPWPNNFIHIGGVDGLLLRNNTLIRTGQCGEGSSSSNVESSDSGCAADVVLYSNNNQHVEETRCVPRSCIIRDAKTCKKGVAHC